MKMPLKSAAVLAAALALALALLAAKLAFEDPLEALARPAGAPVLVSDAVETRGDRMIRRIRLKDPAVGAVSLFASLPAEPRTAKLPVLLVLGGLGEGEANVAAVADPGDNALVGYDWPLPLRIPGAVELLPRLPRLRGRLLGVPGQAAAAAEWLARQAWVDAERLSLVGFSLGALAAPAAQRLAAARGIRMRATILAYGGTGLGALLARHPRVRPEWARAVAALADLLLRPLEPAHHLPHLEGRFLVLAGRDDSFVPGELAARFATLVPEPKSVVVLEGGHVGVGPEQAAILHRALAVSRAWLVAAGAAEPPRDIPER